MASVQYQRNSTQNTIIAVRLCVQEISFLIVKLAERREPFRWSVLGRTHQTGALRADS